MYIENKEDKVFIPQSKHSITANDYNQIKNEIQHAIELAGMTPEKDVIQLPAALKTLTEQSGAEELEKIASAGAEQCESVRAIGQEKVNLAKDWAVKPDEEVAAGEGYSAKYHADRAKSYAEAAIGKCLGEVYWSQSDRSADNPGALPLWTGEYYATASALYPDFYLWVKKHPELCITKADYDERLAQYGECPFYVTDEEAGSLRLPKLVHYIKNANAEDAVTQAKAGLPNITGNIKDGVMTSNAVSSGALVYAQTVGSFNWNGWGGSAGTGELAFDASKSCEVYGGSSDVTPAHTTLYPWVYAYNASVSVSMAQAAEFTHALEEKANRNLENVSEGMDFVVAFGSDGGNWYRKYRSGWVEQGGMVTTAGSVTVNFLCPFSDSGYTLMRTPLGNSNNTTGANVAFISALVSVWNKTATSFALDPLMVWGFSAAHWYACGQGA